MATAARVRIAAVRFGAVPGEEVLVLVEGPAEAPPIVPIFLVHVDDVGLVVAAKVEAQEIFLGQAAGDVVLGVDATLQVAFVGADEAHHIKRAVVGGW